MVHSIVLYFKDQAKLAGGKPRQTEFFPPKSRRPGNPRYDPSLRSQERGNDAIELVVGHAHLGTIQLFVQRPARPAAELRRQFDAEQFPLPGIRVRILLVAPQAGEQQVVRGGLAIVRGKGVGPRVEFIEIRAQDGVPQRPFIRVVLQRADEEVEAGDGVIVGAARGINDGISPSTGCTRSLTRRWHRSHGPLWRRMRSVEVLVSPRRRR